VEQHEDVEYHPQSLRYLDEGTMYTAVGIYNGATLDFSVRVVNDGPVPRGLIRAQLDRQQSQCASAFMLLYNINSWASLDRILQLHRDVIETPYRNDVCILIVGLQYERRNGESFAEEGKSFARSIGASFSSIDSTSVGWVCMAFGRLVLGFGEGGGSCE
jgi:hypothetical protein